MSPRPPPTWAPASSASLHSVALCASPTLVRVPRASLQPSNVLYPPRLMAGRFACPRPAWGPRVGRKETGSFKSRNFRPPRSMWIDNSAEVVADVSVEEAFKLWENRELIPQWMPWIASVKVQEDKPELSKWTLRWEAFGQKIEVNWMARNMQPVANQKIHWRSVDGLPNRGAVRFFRSGPSSCKLEMTISYEVPDFLLPFATAVGPLVESIIKADLDRFAAYARKLKTTAQG